MTDLAAEGDRLHAHMLELIRGDAERGLGAGAQHTLMLLDDLAAALRERDTWEDRADYWGKLSNEHARQRDVVTVERDAERVRAETAEADADRLAALLDRKALRHSTRTVEEGGFVMHLDMEHDPEVVEALAAHAAAVENRHAD